MFVKWKKFTTVTLHTLQDFVKRHFPQAELKEQFGNTLRYQVPTTDPNGVKRNLADMFELVEAKRGRLNIENYAIGQMSLEQIFNTFASQEDNPDNERSRRYVALTLTCSRVQLFFFSFDRITYGSDCYAGLTGSCNWPLLLPRKMHSTTVF